VKALDVAGVDIDAAWEVRAKIRFAADNMRKITEIEEKLSEPEMRVPGESAGDRDTWV
jgi:hypothetical protein